MQNFRFLGGQIGVLFVKLHILPKMHFTGILINFAPWGSTLHRKSSHVQTGDMFCTNLPPSGKNSWQISRYGKWQTFRTFLCNIKSGNCTRLKRGKTNSHSLIEIKVCFTWPSWQRESCQICLYTQEGSSPEAVHLHLEHCKFATFFVVHQRTQREMC